MIGSAMQKAFVRVLVLLILNLEFWLFSLIGLFVLGVGPSLRMMTEIFLNHEFKYREYSLKESWQIYKKYFWVANLHFYAFLVTILFLFYDLYLTSQIKLAWMLPIDILITVVAIFVFLVSLFTLHIESYFDTNFITAIKLGIIEFFADFSGLGKFSFGVIIILGVTRLFPGLLMFMTFSALIVWCHIATNKWVVNIEKQIE